MPERKIIEVLKLDQSLNIPITMYSQQHREIEMIYDYILLHFNELLNYNSRRITSELYFSFIFITAI